MSIQGISSAFNLQNLEFIKNPEEQEQKLREVSCEFEAILTSQILKDSLVKAGNMGDDEGDGGTGTFMEIAYEQIALHVGRQGVMGVADEITRNLKALIDRTPHE